MVTQTFIKSEKEMIMKQCFCLNIVVFTTTILFLFGNFTATSAYALGNKSGEPSQDCRSLVTGAYLSQIMNSSELFASRSIMTFHDNGTIAIIDSAQGQLDFSPLSGTYECISKTKIRALALNFGFSYPGDIARTDWTLEMNAHTGTLEGIVTLIIFEGFEDVNPFGEGGTIIETSTITAIPIPGSTP